MTRTLCLFFPLLLTLSLAAFAAPDNRPERLEWFRDQGFGLFIHWSVDSQLGTVISHSMAGASDDYVKRFLFELPRLFHPRKFYPQDWAALARLAGVRYVVFTTKHHSGFCMWPTATTDFHIGNTPFKRDITGEVLQAFREQGIAPGMYFSPDDFSWLHRNGVILDRHRPEVLPTKNPGLMALNLAQMKELLSKYGPIDILFFDGEAEGLRELSWKMQPNVVVTRGAIKTPEQYVPGAPLEGTWEACLTMGTAWQYQPRNENYKSGWDLISLLVETRARGGNLLLNVGPKPDGELPIEQEERLREMALWMFVNGESIHGTRPWVVTNEGDYWFTRKKGEDTLYVIVKEKQRWQRGEWKEILLRSVQTTAASTASVLGQSDQVLEYRTNVIPKTTFRQEAGGLRIRAMHAQRLQDNSRWPNPVVLKITNVKPALAPPAVETGQAVRGAGGRVTLDGRLGSLGNEKSIEVWFEYRSLKGLDMNERSGVWQRTPPQSMNAPGPFRAEVANWGAGEPYEFRAAARHPALTVYGEGKRTQ